MSGTASRARRALAKAASRDVHFISGLMSHRVPFLVAELERVEFNPNRRGIPKSVEI
jgi:hypothetical protein